MNPADYSKSGYDIQGQIGNASMGKDGSNDSNDSSNVPTGYFAGQNLYDSYQDPAGSGSNTIPATAPSLQDPVVPGVPLTPAQKADLIPVQDPMTSAVQANAAALKDMGVITVSQADVNEEEQGKGVLNVVGTVDRSGF